MRIDVVRETKNPLDLPAVKETKNPLDLPVVKENRNPLDPPMVTETKSPLDLPEIRAVIATYLDRKDLVTCMRVSRDWFKDFVGPVWHTIDMNKDGESVHYDNWVLDKYGRCIRQVFNILTSNDVNNLQHPKVDSLELIEVNFSTPFEPTLAFDLIRRCSATLTHLHFWGPMLQIAIPTSTASARARVQNEHHMELRIAGLCLLSSLGCTNSGSRLTSLSLRRISISHEGFTTLLRNSPKLRKLNISQVAVTHFNSAFDQFRDSSVTHLYANLDEICKPDPGAQWAPSLLHQFSQLQEWHLLKVDRCSGWGSDAEFGREVAECCPRLKSLCFEEADDSDKLSDLLVDSFRRVESCAFSAKNLSRSLVLGLINHFNTLTSVTITDKCVNDADMRWLYLVPRTCSRLEILSIAELVLDLASVKRHEWTCHDLRVLRVRFRGLEDAQLINACIRDVCFQRQRPRRTSTADSVSAQVSSHLLQFSKLSTVSLGAKVYSLPLPSARWKAGL